MVFHPNQQYAYVVNELNSSVDVWELKDPNGQIECVQTLDMMPSDSLTLAGRQIFTSRRMVVSTPATAPPA